MSLHKSLKIISISCNNVRKSSNFYSNPCQRLAQYLTIPLIDENEIPLVPDVRSIELAEDLFIPKPGHFIKTVKKAIDPEHFPSQDLPEIAFIGKSNAGKSSLLQAIFRHVPVEIVKSSKRPGHTKSAQFINVGSKLCLVDMPGYGTLQPAWFMSLVEPYLRYRKNLVRPILLIDSKCGFTDLDDAALVMIESCRIPYAIVLSKIDTASDSILLKNFIHIKKIRENSTSISCFPYIYMVSAKTYDGLGHFLAFIAHITGNLPSR